MLFSTLITICNKILTYHCFVGVSFYRLHWNTTKYWLQLYFPLLAGKVWYFQSVRTSFCHWYLNGYRWITMKWCKCFAKNRTFVAFLAHLNPTQVCKSLPKFSTNQGPISAEQEKGEGGGYNWKGQWDSIKVSSGESYYIPDKKCFTS